MARIDQVKEDISLLKLKLGVAAAAYMAIAGWVVEKIVNEKSPQMPGYISFGVVLLVLLAFYMPVCDYSIRQKIKELGDL